jgi:hypothetical protein
LLLPVLAQAGELGGIVTRNGQPVRDAIVYLDAVATRLPGPTAPAIVEFKDRQLRPRALAAVCGGELILQNADPTLHIVRVETFGRTNSATTLARVAMPYAGFEKRISLPDCRQPQLLRIVGENGEGRQLAYVAIVPHPWVIVTGSTGRFSLGTLPRGRYRVCVWHETHGVLAHELQVPNGREVRVDLRFPATP